MVISQLTLTPMTDATITPPAALRDKCEKIASLGYVFDQQEFVDGLMAIAIPILDEAGAIRAALASHAPVSQFPLAKALARLPALQSAASRLKKSCFKASAKAKPASAGRSKDAGREVFNLPIYNTPLEYPKLFNPVRSEAFAPFRRLGQRFFYKWNWGREEKF